MNIIDLELYRWQLHRLGAFNTLKLKPRSMGLSKLTWWMEYGAFISILPRQSGKTEMLIRMAKILQEEKEPFIFVVPTKTIKDNILQRLNIDPNKIEIIQTATTVFNFNNMEHAPREINLLVDEYTFLRTDTIRNLFKMEWKSISMAGGLNL